MGGTSSHSKKQFGWCGQNSKIFSLERLLTYKLAYTSWDLFFSFGRTLRSRLYWWIPICAWLHAHTHYSGVEWFDKWGPLSLTVARAKVKSVDSRFSVSSGREGYDLFFSPDILQVELFILVSTYCTGWLNSLWYVVNMPLVYSSQLELPRVTANYPRRYWVILKPVWFEMTKHSLINVTSNIGLPSLHAVGNSSSYISVYTSVLSIEL